MTVAKLKNILGKLFCAIGWHEPTKWETMYIPRLQVKRRFRLCPRCGEYEWD